jgi:hypothetical protein
LFTLAAIPWGSRGPDPPLFGSGGPHAHGPPHFFLLKSAFFKSKCTLIYCDNNQFVRTTGDDSIKPSLNFLAFVITYNTVFITVVVNPFDPVYL